MSIPITRRIPLSRLDQSEGSGGRHDDYGFALTAQPGEAQRRPATNTSSQLVVCIGLPAPSCSRCLCPGWSHHSRASEKRSRTSALRISYRLPTRSSACTSSSGGASRLRPCCRRPKPRQFVLGVDGVRSNLDEKSMAGRRYLSSLSISRLTSPHNLNLPEAAPGAVAVLKSPSRRQNRLDIGL